MKEKSVASKSKIKEQRVSNFSLVTMVTFVIMYAIVCGLIVWQNVSLQDFNKTFINAPSSIMLAVFAVLFFVCVVSFLIIEKQGANKKTFALFYVLLSSILICVFLYYTLIFTWGALFVSALSLFFCLVLLHELKKTNKKAYYLHFIVCLICAYLVINFYVICLIN